MFQGFRTTFLRSYASGRVRAWSVRARRVKARPGPAEGPSATLVELALAGPLRNRLGMAAKAEAKMTPEAKVLTRGVKISPKAGPWTGPAPSQVEWAQY